MKPGLKRGQIYTWDVTVMPEMTVEFAGKPLHPFYPTYWACHHAEYACRQLLEPYLDDHEDGIGSGLFIHHHAPALVGQTLHIAVTVTKTRGHHLVCHFEMTERSRKIAHGDVHQVILPKERIAQMRIAASASNR